MKYKGLTIVPTIFNSLFIRLSLSIDKVSPSLYFVFVRKFSSTTISLSLVGSFPSISSTLFILFGNEEIFTTYSLLFDDNKISVE